MSIEALHIIFGAVGFILGIILAALVAVILISRRGQKAKEGYVQAQTALAARNAEFERLVHQNEQRESELKGALAQEQRHKHEALTRLSAVEAQRASERKHVEESQKAMQDRFESLANRIFEDKSRKFTEQNKENIGNLLNPLQQNISEFKKKVEETYDKESRDRTALHEHIKQLESLNSQLSSNADNLAKALTGDNKVMGNWGEQTLERILEISGLEKGREYEVQVSTRSAEGRLYRPDVIIRLPESRDIIVDSKVSLSAYERYYSAEGEDEQSKALAEHIASVRRHIKELSAKNYDELEGIQSLDYVLLFVPIEAAYIAAIREDQHMYNEAFKQNIVIVCPSTLLVTLRIIANIWRYEKQNQYAKTIASKASALYGKFAGFAETLLKVRASVQRASDDCDKAVNQLSTGRGNIVGRIEEFKELGIETKKQIPDALFLGTDNDAEDISNSED